MSETEDPLDVTKTGSLTKRQDWTLQQKINEDDRQADTSSYYTSVPVDNAGSKIDGPQGTLKTLSAFKTRYFSSGVQRVAYYYNRGDLGLGREMHCSDGLTATGGQIACYVSNFAAGTDGTEFTFGLSSSIAFSNMAANHPFATVAMVYRNDAQSHANNVFFVVYNAAGNLQRFAALDRAGQLFANDFAGPKISPSVPGENFNNHVPSNCMSCHSGNYDSGTHSATGSLFLPFDLDQFDYQNVAGRTRSDQLASFKGLNEMVWKVAALSGSDATSDVPAINPVRAQLNRWYHNTTLAPLPKDEVFENAFDSTVVPQGWSSPLGKALYQSVVRGSCRNCHQANMGRPFETEDDFVKVADTAAGDICGFAMPHALQTVRQFWQSSQPTALAQYLSAKGLSNAAATLRSCGPKNVVTMDPPLIVGVNY